MQPDWLTHANLPMPIPSSAHCSVHFSIGKTPRCGNSPSCLKADSHHKTAESPCHPYAIPHIGQYLAMTDDGLTSRYLHACQTIAEALFPEGDTRSDILSKAIANLWLLHNTLPPQCTGNALARKPEEETMNCLLVAFLLLALFAAATGGIALLPLTERTTRLANCIGPCGAVLGCLVGLCAVIAGTWHASLTLTLPWGLPIGSCTLGLDPLTRLFLFPVFGLGAICALAGGISLRHTEAGTHNLGAHWFFYLLLILGMAAVMTARDTVLFLIAWELMSLAPFFLIDFNDGDRLVRDASWVYLVAAHLGAVLLIAFFALLWQLGGDTSFAGLAQLPSGSWTPALFILAVLGFGAKAGLAPLHVWLPEAHPAAPSHVSALLSGAMINAGLYGIIRTLDFLGPRQDFSAWWGWLLLFLGLATGIMGILKALAQTHLKRMLAYSSVENMGLMLMGVGIGIIGLASKNAWIATLGFAGSLFHMLNHAAFKGLLFLCAGEILHAVGTVRMDQLGGLQKRLPLVGILFALGAAAIACLPPLNGFAGELVLFLALVKGTALSGVENQLGLFTALTGLALISGLAAATYSKAYGMTFLGEPRTGFAASAVSPSWKALLPLCIPALVCIAVGLAAPVCFSGVATAALHVAKVPLSLLEEAENGISSATGILNTTSLLGFSGIVLTLIFLALRRRLLKNRSVRKSSTWGCGYQFGTPRIQYTDASFSEPVGKLFGSAMGLKIHTQRDDSYFPDHGTFAISAPDRLRTGLFTPLFEGIERLCNALKIVQHGRIHLYILYILATVVILLVWGLHA